jgi:hypothetical protein
MAARTAEAAPIFLISKNGDSQAKRRPRKRLTARRPTRPTVWALHEPRR